ncbi:MAG: hypothetical protein ACLR13_05360 [Acutalibacteraceae bacterium]
MNEMEFVKGLVVRSKAGHDKGSFYLVLGLETDMAVVCDGSRRALLTQRERSYPSFSDKNGNSESFNENQSRNL